MSDAIKRNIKLGVFVMLVGIIFSSIGVVLGNSYGNASSWSFTAGAFFGMIVGPIMWPNYSRRLSEKDPRRG